MDRVKEQKTAEVKKYPAKGKVIPKE